MRFHENIILRNSRLVSKDLIASFINGLNADNLVVERDIMLSDNFEAEGEVNLVGANIGQNLECRDGRFANKGETPALDAKSANIQGLVVGKGLQS